MFLHFSWMPCLIKNREATLPALPLFTILKIQNITIHV